MSELPQIHRAALTEDVAKKYSVTVRTVQIWVKKNWIPSMKIGGKLRRYDMDAVDRALLERFGAGGAR